MIAAVLEFATGRRVVGAFLMLVVVGSLLFRISPYSKLKTAVEGRSLPEEGLTSPGELSAFLEQLGTEGRELYLQFQLWDVLNPLLIGTAGLLLIAWLIKRRGLDGSAWRFAVLLPIAAAAADLLENGVLSIAGRKYPDAAPLTAMLMSVSAAKFGLFLLVIVTALGLAVSFLGARRRHNAE